jgi:hypothetical protein
MNMITLQATKFVNMPSGEETFGYRMYDNHGQAYNNTLEKIPEDDLELLEIVMQSDEIQISDMLDFLLEYAKGLYINGEWYNWCDIKHLWNK